MVATKRAADGILETLPRPRSPGLRAWNQPGGVDLPKEVVAAIDGLKTDDDTVFDRPVSIREMYAYVESMTNAKLNLLGKFDFTNGLKTQEMRIIIWNIYAAILSSLAWKIVIENDAAKNLYRPGEPERRQAEAWYYYRIYCDLEDAHYSGAVVRHLWLQ